MGGDRFVSAVAGEDVEERFGEEESPGKVVRLWPE
jgi:hypothetical protein